VSGREGCAVRGLGTNVDGSVAIRRVGDYAVEYDLLKLTDVAGQDQAHGRRVHQPGGQRRHRRLSEPMRGPWWASLPDMGRIAAPAVYKIKGE